MKILRSTNDLIIIFQKVKFSFYNSGQWFLSSAPQTTSSPWKHPKGSAKVGVLFYRQGEIDSIFSPKTVCGPGQNIHFNKQSLISIKLKATGLGFKLQN